MIKNDKTILYEIFFYISNYLGMKNKENIMVCCFLNPVRDYSSVEKNHNVRLRMPLGMRTNIKLGCIPNGMLHVGFAHFFYRAIIPNGIQFKKTKPVQVIYFSLLKIIMKRYIILFIKQYEKTEHE